MWFVDCSCSELKTPSVASMQRASKALTKASLLKTNVLPEYHGERWFQMLCWLVVTRLCNTHSLVECSHVKTMLGQREALELIIVPTGLPSCSICCSICIPLRSLRHKTPTVAACHVLYFSVISISRTYDPFTAHLIGWR